MPIPDQVLKVAEEKVAEEVFRDTALTALGVAIPVAGVAILGAKLVGSWFSSDDSDGEQAALKEWIESQPSPVSDTLAHGFISGYRWAKK